MMFTMTHYAIPPPGFLDQSLNTQEAPTTQSNEIEHEEDGGEKRVQKRTMRDTFQLKQNDRQP